MGNVRMFKGAERGFTLIEILLSVALFSIIAGVGAVALQGLQVRNDLDVATESVVQSLRRAQVLARAMEGDSSWGVHVETGAITVFQGASFASRTQGFDEVFTVSPTLVFSGLSEVVFGVFTGEPQSTGSIVLTNQNNEINTITINAKGTISY